MKRTLPNLFVCLGALLAVGLALPAWAETDGNISTALAHKLSCDLADLLQGELGLLIGLTLVFMGLWSMVKGAKPVAAAPFIILGALVTALPSILMVLGDGLGSLLMASGISTSKVADAGNMSDSGTGDASSFMETAMNACDSVDTTTLKQDKTAPTPQATGGYGAGPAVDGMAYDASGGTACTGGHC